MSISKTVYNESLINNIRLNKESRDKVVYDLYYDEKLRAHFKKMMNSVHYDPSEFDPIFNQALMQFVSTVVKRKDFVLTREYVSYITVIGRNAYLKFLKQKNIQVESEKYENVWATNEEPENLLINLEKKDLIYDLLGKIGEKCREVLLLWGNGYSMAEIADRLQYKSDGMARKKKYKCFKSLQQFIKENPNYKNILIG